MFRSVIFEDGTIKQFEDVVEGDIFKIQEPDGKILSNSEGLEWFKSDSDYSDDIQGFTGLFIKGK